MNLHYLVHSLVNLIIAVFFLLLGILSLIVPWNPLFKTTLIQFFLENSIAISLFGFVFIVVGAAIIVQIILSTKRRYYSIRSKHNIIYVDRHIIEAYLNSYWKDLLPEIEIPTQITVKDNKIYVAADLPAFPLEQQKPIVQTIERDLNKLFSKILGYRSDLFLTLSFPENTKST